ncbi:hypothetical protein KEM56_003974 [Ascosphaera pollenicola]|nr:hypothetical protein KEM56_003974 [Ascosphaera pollenicola]
MSQKRAVAIDAPDCIKSTEQTFLCDSTEEESRPSTPEDYPDLLPQHHSKVAYSSPHRRAADRMMDHDLSMLQVPLNSRRSPSAGCRDESAERSRAGSSSPWSVNSTMTRRTQQNTPDIPQSRMSTPDMQSPNGREQAPSPVVRSRTTSERPTWEAESPSFMRSTGSSKNSSLIRSKSSSMAKETKPTTKFQSKTHVASLPQKAPAITSSCLQKTLMSQRAARAKLQAKDVPKIPNKFKDKHHSRTDSGSSLVSSPRFSSFKFTASRRRLSAVQPPKVPKAALTGVREMDRHVSILSKENFDLKLRLHHKSQQLGALQSELRHLSCVENEVVNLKESEKEAKRQASLLRSDLLELQEEHARSNESKNLLIDMLRRRDDGLKEAAAIICELEDTIGDLQRQLPKEKHASHVRTDSYASDIWRDLTNETEALMLDKHFGSKTFSYISSPTSIPERTSSLRATDANRTQAMQESRLTSRIPHSDQAALQRRSFQSEKHQGRVSFAGQPHYHDVDFGDAQRSPQKRDSSAHDSPLIETLDKHTLSSKHDLRIQLNKLTSSLNEAEKLFAEVGRGSPDRRALFDPFLAPLEDLAAVANSRTEMSGCFDDVSDNTSMRPSTAPPCSDSARSNKSHSRSYESQSRASRQNLTILSNVSSLSVKSEPADVDEGIKSDWCSHTVRALESPRSSSMSVRPVTANYDGVGDFSRNRGLQAVHMKRPHSSGGAMISDSDYRDKGGIAEGRAGYGKKNHADVKEATPRELPQKAPLTSGNNSAASRISKITISSDCLPKRPGTIGEVINRPETRTRTDLLRSLTKRAKERQNRFLDHTNVKNDSKNDEDSVKTPVEERERPSNTWTNSNVPSSTSLQKPTLSTATQLVSQKAADVPLGPPSLSSRRKPALSIDTTHSTTASLRSFDNSLTSGRNSLADGLDTDASSSRHGKRKGDVSMTLQYEQQLKSVTPTTGRASSTPTPVLMLNNAELFQPELDPEPNSVSLMSVNTRLSPRSALQLNNFEMGTGQEDAWTTYASSKDAHNCESSKGRAKMWENKEGAALEEAKIKDCDGEFLHSPVEESNSSVFANAGSIEDNSLTLGTWDERKKDAKPVDQEAQGNADLSGSSGSTTEEKRSSRPLHNRTVSEAHITAISSYTRTGRGSYTTASVPRSVSHDRGSMEVAERPTAPLVDQDEWPGSQFQEGFSVDLKSAMEFEQWQERARQTRAEQPTPTALPPYFDGLGVHVPSSPFVPIYAGSTVTVVTAGPNNAPKPHQGLRRRMLQPFGKRSPEYNQSQRSPMSPPTCTKPSTPTVLSPTGGFNSALSKPSPSPTQSDSSTGRHGQKSSTKGDQTNEGAKSGEDDETSPMDERPEMDQSDAEQTLKSPVSSNVLRKNIPSDVAARMTVHGSSSSSHVNSLKSPTRQSPTTLRPTKNTAAGQSAHKPRFSSSIFGWMKPSARSRQEACGNIKSLNCAQRDSSPPSKSKENLEGQKSPFTSPVSRLASEFEPSKIPRIPATPHQANEVSLVKGPVMKSGRSHTCGSREADRGSSSSPNSFYRPDLINNQSALVSTTSPVSPRHLEPPPKSAHSSKLPRSKGFKGSPR